jgi:hypothetical protein
MVLLHDYLKITAFLDKHIVKIGHHLTSEKYFENNEVFPPQKCM